MIVFLRLRKENGHPPRSRRSAFTHSDRFGYRIPVESEQSSTPAAPRGAKQPRPRRKLTWRGRLLLICFGLLLIGCLEGGLRLAGFGGSQPLTRLLIWKKTEGEELRLVETNQSFLEVFFARPVSDGSLRSGSMVTERFFLPKPKGTFRIIMIGESTIQGFPMPRNLTSSAFLQEYLRRSMPGRDVEVLNFGATAAASFPIRKIGEEAMKELEPDALVVYGAHNEFFGASGMASFQRLGTSVAMMQFSWRLRHTGMVSALQWSMTRLAKKKAKEEAKKEDRTLIEIMAGTDFVEPGGPLHEQARRSLETNWDALRKAGLTRGVPVIFCTVASNEAGMAPMVSSGTGLSPELMKELNALLEKPTPTADAAWKDRADELDAMLKKAPGHALLNYRAAEANQKAGRKAEALKLYQQARDLDALPWRAASDKNEVIRGVAQREGAHLADAAAAFEKEAGGATDWLLFDDHVHPSLRGQALLAETIARTMMADGLLPDGSARAESLPAWGTLSAALGAHPLERFRVINMMTSIYKNPPMRLNNEAAYLKFEGRLKEMIASADPYETDALSRWNAVAQVTRESVPISYFALAAALRQSLPDKAAVYTRGSVLNATPFSDERIAARFLQLLVLAESGISADQFELQRQAVEKETAFVASLPGQPTALLAYSQAGLSLLGGDTKEAEDYLAISMERKGQLSDRTKFFMNELPPPAALPGVVDHARKAIGTGR